MGIIIYLSRVSTRVISPELQVDHARYMRIIHVPQSSFTLILKGLLIYLMTYLEGVPLALRVY